MWINKVRVGLRRDRFVRQRTKNMGPPLSKVRRCYHRSREC